MTPLKFIWKSSKRSTSILPEDALTRLLCKRTHATLATLFKTILHSCPTHFQFENLKYNAVWRSQRRILGEDRKGRSKVIGRCLRSARRKARLTPVLAQGSPGSPAAQPALAALDLACKRARLSLRHPRRHLTTSEGRSTKANCHRELPSQLFLRQTNGVGQPSIFQRQGKAVHASPPAGYHQRFPNHFWPFTKL